MLWILHICNFIGMGLQDTGISSIPGYIYIFEVADEPKKHDLLIGEQK